MSIVGLAGEAVLECVLQQRLQNEIGNGGIARFRRDRPADAHALTRTQAHDVQVTLRQIQLGVERNLLAVALLHHCSQQLGEIDDRFVGPRRVTMQHSRDGVESVEEEVRVQLRPQCRQLHLGEAALELELKTLALLELPVVLEAVHDGDRRPENHQLDDHVAGKNPGERRRVVTGSPLLQRKKNRVLGDADEDAGEEERGDGARPRCAERLEPAHQPVEKR